MSVVLPPPATMYFHFVLLPPLLPVCPNCLTVLSSHPHGGLTKGRFRFLEYHSTTARVNLLSVNLVMCPTMWNSCYRYSAVTSFTPFRSRFTSLYICSRNDIPSKDLSICCNQLLFFVVVDNPLAYNIANKTVLRKRISRRVLSSFALSTSFMIGVIYMIIKNDKKKPFGWWLAWTTSSMEFEFQLSLSASLQRDKTPSTSVLLWP